MVVCTVALVANLISTIFTDTPLSVDHIECFWIPFKVSTMANNSFSVVVWFICAKLSFLEKKEMGISFWLMAAPIWYLLASVWISKGLLKSEYTSKVFLATAALTSSKAFCSTLVHFHSTLVDTSFVRGASFPALPFHLYLYCKRGKSSSSTLPHISVEICDSYESFQLCPCLWRFYLMYCSYFLC